MAGTVFFSGKEDILVALCCCSKIVKAEAGDVMDSKNDAVGFLCWLEAVATNVIVQLPRGTKCQRYEVQTSKLTTLLNSIDCSPAS